MVLLTVKLNAARLAVALATSCTVMTIFVVVPISSLVGVPDNAPVAVLNVAQEGIVLILNVCESPSSTSITVGVKLYSASSATVAKGVPEITGTSLVLLTTNTKVWLSTPLSSSLTRIVTLLLPVSSLVGVPDRVAVPLPLSTKLNQLGLLLAEMIRLVSSTSLALIL